MSNLYGQFDCSMPRDPRLVAAGPLARLVYYEAILYCRENLTDGVIDERTLRFWGTDVPRKRALLARLLREGALELHPLGWAVPSAVWRRWNPTRAEVEAKRAAEAERKAAYRDKHRNVPDVSQRDNDGTDEGVPTGQRVPATLRDRQPEPEPEPEPEPIGISSTDRFNRTDPPPVENHRIEDALKHLVEHRINGRAQGKNPAYRRTVLADVRTAHLAELQRLAAKYPTAPADVLAASAQGDTHSLRYHTEPGDDQ